MFSQTQHIQHFIFTIFLINERLFVFVCALDTGEHSVQAVPC